VIAFSSLRRLEHATVKAVILDGAFGALPQFLCAAQTALGRISASSPEQLDIHLSFDLPTRFRENKFACVNRRFHVGCKAEKQRGEDVVLSHSYSVAIERQPGSRRVARKFHFDYEPLFTRNDSEPKPTFHLQLCGELSGHHRDDGIDDADIDHLLPSWSKPRVPAAPMSLALVLDWLLMEFSNEPAVHSARMGRNWASAVRRAEQEILRPYYSRCVEAISVGAEASFLMARIYRGDD
jgi:hypothetical protein